MRRKHAKNMLPKGLFQVFLKDWALNYKLNSQNIIKMPGVKMRNFSKFLGAYFIALLLAAVATISLVGCDRFGGCEPASTIDSMYIAESVDAIVNPSFTSVSEIIEFQNVLAEEYSIDETFRSLPRGVLTNVATVCIKKYLGVTKKDIVKEYRANKSVYDNLEPDTTANKSTQEDHTTVVEGQQTPVPISTSYHYEVDTINGQPTKVLVKEEKYESK